jgi:hypothetical protein
MGRPGSEEAVLLDAVNAIADTLDLMRTRINAAATIDAADVTCFKILPAGPG